MNKKYISLFICLSLICCLGASKYNGSTKASVVLAGAIIKSQSLGVEKKYKRKDCPVCKGKGWYVSGDDITKVECGYCEPESSIKIQQSGTCTTTTQKK
jgi:hypothetical protein